jgi:hypothetical protein
MEDTTNPNAVGFCWFGGGTMCAAIWWNEGGWTGNTDKDGQPIYGCMQGQIANIRGISEEDDINHTISWGHQLDLDIACMLIDRYGAWLKPSKLEWRPKPETNSPLKFKLSYKNTKPKTFPCGRCGSDGGTEEPHSCPYSCEINDDYSENCNCCDSCSHECAMDV